MKVDTYIDVSGRKITTEYEEDAIAGTHKQMLQTYVSRYLRRARKYLANVCKGKFP